MFFVTNKAINEPLLSKIEVPRRITFNTENNQAGQSIYFCRRNGANDYTEIGSANLLEELRVSPAEQILVYIHGFNNQPESDIFPRAQELQRLFDAVKQNLVLVLPIIWPCSDHIGIIRDYYYDEDAADASAFAFARLLEKFLNWQKVNCTDGVPSCLKRINMLAHSMGNRVLRGTLQRWREYGETSSPLLLFRNTFLVAADIEDESLQKNGKGTQICELSRNVTVYYANDDLALRTSKVANDGNMINGRRKRRLGHSGAEDTELLPRNVYLVDCDEINNLYDKPKGHAYFLNDDKGQPGLVFQHILHSVQCGRVDIDAATRMKILGCT
ncbi:alpha/beta hydrolase [Geobacter sp. SVR]|uniref:alpha/beta hydrolase n=1 Tax=Geobacter sp. SVR TaxID=2495594 RepID=UPI00143EFFBD|nr:alpha/beta hydrolase [Geobacter sp. SVR]BCS53131.1 hypothetical protein GSVR_14390 [Geobacter sp. SVR]GCF84516.1 hypothetical protein GSbR_11160 [Geobacter sp. SVR]